MVNGISPGKTLGLIGGSALAYHLLLTAKQMGYNVAVYCNDQTSPILKSADWAMVGSYNDREALRELAYETDFIIYETEELSSEMIEYLQKMVAVPQGNELLAIVQDRVLQKAYLEANSINIAPYATIVSPSDIEEAVKSIGYPCVLKTNRTDKQFNEQVVLYDESDIENASQLLEKGVCVLEAMVPYERELEVTVVRNQDGHQVVYPVSETIYREESLYQVITPARISSEVEEEVERIARLLSLELDVIGALSLEFFVTTTGTLYVNTLIFGPHLAGNYANDFANLSQSEAHIRGVANWPLEDPELFQSTVLMPFHRSHIEKIEKQIIIKPHWRFHFYPNIGRKIREKELGYVTIPTTNLDRTLELLADIELWEESTTFN